jgi:hypothetical protein
MLTFASFGVPMAAKKTADETETTVETVEELVPDADAELGAAEAEATGDVIEVEHNGKVYSLPSPLDYPVDVVFAGKHSRGMRSRI